VGGFGRVGGSERGSRDKSSWECGKTARNPLDFTAFLPFGEIT